MTLTLVFRCLAEDNLSISVIYGVDADQIKARTRLKYRPGLSRFQSRARNWQRTGGILCG